MTTQAIIRIDKKLKEKAQRKAKNLGITFSDVVQMTTRAFVENKISIGVMEKEEKLNAKIRRELIQISKDIARGKNLSPVFGNAKDAVAWLNSSK